MTWTDRNRNARANFLSKRGVRDKQSEGYVINLIAIATLKTATNMIYCRPAKRPGEEKQGPEEQGSVGERDNLEDASLMSNEKSEEKVVRIIVRNIEKRI